MIKDTPVGHLIGFGLTCIAIYYLAAYHGSQPMRENAVVWAFFAAAAASCHGFRHLFSRRL